MPDYRITFTKLDSLKYISHLDLQRAMTRLLVRSKLPVVYSEGFNPHPRMSFAVPLSIFQEGENEILDVKLSEEVPLQSVLDSLNAQTFPGMKFTKAVKVEKKLPAKFAVYRLEYRTDMEKEEFIKAFSSEMTVLRKTKTKEMLMDIAPKIKFLSAVKNGNILTARVELPASNTDYLNPSYITEFFGERVKILRTVRESIIF